jgi:hypothetical protein
VDDLELDPVRVVEEDRVVAGHVAVLARGRLDLGADRDEPVVALVDDRARARLEREVVEADPVAVDPAQALRWRSPTELPGPPMYQIVSPRSPSTSPIRW